jgi:PAS domain S-box-containing protein
MKKHDVYTTGIEREMGPNDIIVSKTNLKGHIIYGNDVFCHIADYTVNDIIDQPHNILRHPDMPRCIFKLLWDYIQAGKEIFAYVVNRGKRGDHYWVLAHVTPSFDSKGNIIGYHSNRRRPSRNTINAVQSLYATLLAEENRHGSHKDGLNASTELLKNILKEKGVTYDEFILSI